MSNPAFASRWSRFRRGWWRWSAAWLGVWLAQPAIATPCPPPAPVVGAAELAQARRDASDRGLLWRVTRDGRTSWLYGTLHVARVDWVVPGPGLLRALQASDVLALELNPLDTEALRPLGAAGDPARNRQVLTPARRARLANALARACLPSDALAGLRPAVRAATLIALSGRDQGLYPEFGIDAGLAVLAQQARKPVRALETAEQQLALLAGRDAAEEGALLDGFMDALEAPHGSAVLGRLAQAWADGDEATLADYPRWCQCLDTEADRALMRDMLARNHPMADKIAAWHHAGQRVLAAVGALHLVGPDGLPALLRARGFEVERVPPVRRTQP